MSQYADLCERLEQYGTTHVRDWEGAQRCELEAAAAITQLERELAECEPLLEKGADAIAQMRAERDAALKRVGELEAIRARDKPDACANGCPPFTVCDYCQTPGYTQKEMDAVERQLNDAIIYQVEQNKLYGSAKELSTRCEALEALAREWLSAPTREQLSLVIARTREAIAAREVPNEQPENGSD